jgi:hypothetical protein
MPYTLILATHDTMFGEYSDIINNTLYYEVGYSWAMRRLPNKRAASEVEWEREE